MTGRRGSPLQVQPVESVPLVEVRDEQLPSEPAVEPWRGAFLPVRREQKQRSKVRATGLADLCGTVFASAELPAAKPDPRAYAAACAGLGVDPAQALMVGDNYDLDVVAARASGLDALHLDRAGLHRDPACSCLRDLASLPLAPLPASR